MIMVAVTSLSLSPTAIPHSKEVITMASNFDLCNRTMNEVKSGACVEPAGTKITLRVTNQADMGRDVLKVFRSSVLMSFL